MENGEKYGCLTLIVVIVGVIIFRNILCNKVDGFFFITHDPIEYCKKYPSGRYQGKALDKIIAEHKKRGYIPKLYTQKRLSDFIQPLPDSPQKDTLEVISKRLYEKTKEDASKCLLPDDILRYEEAVEDKYKPTIAMMRADLERRWQDEPSAWEIVCNDTDSWYFHDNEVLECYLKYHPNGEHVLEAYRIIVKNLKEENESLRDDL